MANGFIGAASDRYFSRVEEAVDRGNQTISAAGGKGNARRDDSRGYPTGIGTCQNIAVDEEIYDHALRSITRLDEDMANRIYDVIAQIEALCETDFVVPDTLPRLRATIDPIKQSLSEFKNVTSEATHVTRMYVGEIAGSDH